MEQSHTLAAEAILQPGANRPKGELAAVRRLLKIGFVIVWAAIFVLPGVVADERIEFAPPGPPHTIAFDDALASASVTFRVSHDAHKEGPEGPSPSISSGSLMVHAFGVSRRYDLSTIFPIATNRILLSKQGDCGTATALSRRNDYIVVEATLAEKGCAPLAAFIDLRDGRVAKEAIFDPASVHRFDVHPYHASGAPIRIVRVERVVPQASIWNPGASPTMIAWPFLVVHATDARGATLVFAIDPGNQPAFDKRAVALNAGDAALLGTAGIGDKYVLVQFFSGELFVRPLGTAEVRFDALQTPTPKDVQAQIRRNNWFTEASERAQRGNIVGAVDAFATMVSFHGGGGDIDSADAAMLATCRDLVRRVRAGTVSASAAGRAFEDGCVIKTTRVTRPVPRVSN